MLTDVPFYKGTDSNGWMGNGYRGLETYQVYSMLHIGTVRHDYTYTDEFDVQQQGSLTVQQTTAHVGEGQLRLQCNQARTPQDEPLTATFMLLKETKTIASTTAAIEFQAAIQLKIVTGKTSTEHVVTSGQLPSGDVTATDGVITVRAPSPSAEQILRYYLLPVDIEPDANMAGMVGDVVKSAKAGSTIKHFVTPKKSTDLPQDYVELKAAGVDAAKFDEMLVWEGGEAGSSAEKRKVKRDVVGKTEMKIKAKQSGSVVKQMDVWVVWVDIKPKDKPAAPTWWHSVDTLPDGNQLLAPICEARWQFEGEVKPASVVDNTANAEIPDLKGEPATPTPETGKAHKFDGDTFLKPENKWDMSRQIRVKVLSPNIGTAEFDATWPNLFAGLPSASKIVEDYPTDTLYGNDDSSGQPNEHTDPYTGGGKILDSDKPRIHGPNHDRPAVGSTYEMRYQFREFSRLEIGGTWYRVSDPYLWRLHMKAKKVPQISIDPDDNPFDPNTDPNTNRPPITNPGFENDGSVTDETNSQW